ncbi:MAG TPA: peptidoglycan-associated lipoprotein Pal [Acidobacteriota bacterium]
MRALTQQTSVAAVLLIAAGMLSACSSQEPPAAEPVAAAPVERPVQQAPPQEVPEAEDWDTNPPATGVLTLEDINRQGILKAIYFYYDSADIRPDQRATLQANAQFLRENAQVRVLVAGHCDERGTREYNMALGERRAAATMQYLVSLGVPRERIEIISYGEEQPAVPGSSESAWSQNRRAQFQAIGN